MWNCAHHNTVKLLVEHKAIVDVPDDKCTLLEIAAYNGKTDIVRELLQHGADKTMETSDIEMMISISVEKGHESVAKCLQKVD